MQTLSTLSFFAALGVFAATASLPAVAGIFFVAGLAAIVAQDYGRRRPRVPLVRVRTARKLHAQFRPPALAWDDHRAAA